MSPNPAYETPNWTRFVFPAMLLCLAQAFAQPAPQPPCGQEPVPPYPNLDQPATVQSWNKSTLSSNPAHNGQRSSVTETCGGAAPPCALGGNWMPPACTGWMEAGFSTLIATVARFRFNSQAEGLLRRIGAISELKGVRYWSTTHKRWQTLVEDAHALTGPQFTQRREDFKIDEMKAGSVLYFEQIDNLAGKAIYRMRIAEASADRIVYTIENVNAMRYFFVTLFPPGELQSAYFLDRESQDIWKFYGIVRTGKNSNRLITGNESSSINRAVAFYRQLTGIPTDQEPPAAR
jgi:hypothetical protein